MNHQDNTIKGLTSFQSPAKTKGVIRITDYITQLICIMRETSYHTSVTYHLCDIIQWKIYFYLDWYSNGTQNLISNEL